MALDSMNSTSSDDRVELAIATDELGWGALSEFRDQLANAEIGEVEITSQRLDEPRKSLGEIAVALAVIAASVRTAGPTLVMLLAELLHRPGKPEVRITRTDSKGRETLTVISGSGLRPSDFPKTVEALDKLLGPASGKK